MADDVTTYAHHYSDEGFQQKLRRFAVKAGRQVVEQALTLYYAMQSPATPKWAKAVIVGALGYFILPLDAIPDLIPGVGFTDDFATLAAAIATVARYVTDEHRRKAAATLGRWLPAAVERSEADPA